MDDETSILVVDEDPGDRAVLADPVCSAGFSVEIIDDHERMVARLREQGADLVLIDPVALGASLENLVGELKADPKLARVPVIAILGDDSFDKAADYVELGIEDFARRPLDRTLTRARILAAIHNKKMRDESASQVANFMALNDIGIALSAEKNLDRLLEMILLHAKQISNSDGGSLYLRTEDDRLKFAIMRTDSLNFALGGTTGREIPFPPLPMYNPETGEPNHSNIATHAALSGESVNIPDAYEAQGFDFSGTRAFDEKTGYRSKSFATIPMKNSVGEVIGVLQLLNASDERSGEVIAFSPAIQKIVESLASQAAVAVDNQMLLQGQKDLLDSFIKLIASAIDAKSPYTGGHCARVPVLTELIAGAACDAQSGPFADFDLNEDQRYELHTAGWLHDCGKVTTPEYVVDKATKLETIFDRVELVRTRFEILKRDAEIDYLKVLGEPDADAEACRARLEDRLAQLRDDRGFIDGANVGGEFMSDEKIDRVKSIASYQYADADNKIRDFLTDNEVYNLSIRKGTLTAEEREVINNHIVMTLEMLEKLPFPKSLRLVPEFAGGHHERMDGKGYPRGLHREDMSMPARMMAIADVFEALTACDRPYKKAMKLSSAMDILGKMKQEHHIDPDLFDLFVENEVHLKYAEQFLLPEQIDSVDVSKYLGPMPGADDAPAPAVKKSA
jgi:HD-GYP domain-containing protein (c-di-GMP phosphodiesterase class II)/DNA-binding response OmpR family regulator